MIPGGSVGTQASHPRGLAGPPGPGSPGPAHPDTGRPGPAAPGGRGAQGLAAGAGCAVAGPAWSDSAPGRPAGCEITASLPSIRTATWVRRWMAGIPG
jgi:hypothetical protein